MRLSRLLSVVFLLSLLSLMALMADNPYHHSPVFFNIDKVFDDPSSPGKINAAFRSKLKPQILEAKSKGLTPVGIVPVWVFPEYLDYPKEPRRTFVPPNQLREPVRLSCIPDFTSSEYLYWAGVRNQFFTAIATEFPEIENWIIGFEPNIEVFCDCQGRQLDVSDYVRFAADTLYATRDAVRRANAKASIIAHFLGTPVNPMQFPSGVVQPSQIVGSIREEIVRRGHRDQEYFDQLMTSFDPRLEADRHPEPARPVNLMQVETTTGWNQFWLEHFDDPATNLTTDYPGYLKILTDEATGSEGWVHITTAPVSGSQVQLQTVPFSTAMDDLFPQGWATNRFTQPSPGVYVPKEGTSIAGGGRTDFQVVPDQYFPIYTLGFSERNLWTVVMDYYPLQPLPSDDNHNPVFLRVNDRVCPGENCVPNESLPCCWVQNPNLLPQDKVYRYTGSGYELTRPSDQTRFGTIVWRRASPTGSLELVGDSLAEGEAGSSRMQLIDFPLTYEPYQYPGRLFRNQILEKEYCYYWEMCDPMWSSEVWDLSYDCSGVPSSLGCRIGVSAPQWVTKYTLENNYKIDTPPRTGSRVMFSLGPGDGGSIGAERVGTAYYVP